MAYILNSPVFTGAVTLLNGPLILSASQGIVIPDGAPSITTNTLYNVGGALYFDETLLSGSGGGGGSIGEINCGTSVTEANATLIDCGAAA